MVIKLTDRQMEMERWTVIGYQDFDWPRSTSVMFHNVYVHEPSHLCQNRDRSDADADAARDDNNDDNNDDDDDNIAGEGPIF